MILTPGHGSLSAHLGPLGTGQFPTVIPSLEMDNQYPPGTFCVLESDVRLCLGHHWGQPHACPSPTGHAQGRDAPHEAQPDPGDRQPQGIPFPPSPCIQPCSALPARDTTDVP